MNKSAGQNKQVSLKRRIEESHNSNDQLVSLVKLLARRAAEQDYESLGKREPNQDIKGEEQ